MNAKAIPYIPLWVHREAALHAQPTVEPPRVEPDQSNLPPFQRPASPSRASYTYLLPQSDVSTDACLVVELRKHNFSSARHIPSGMWVPTREHAAMLTKTLTEEQCSYISVFDWETGTMLADLSTNTDKADQDQCRTYYDGEKKKMAHFDAAMRQEYEAVLQERLTTYDRHHTAHILALESQRDAEEWKKEAETTRETELRWEKMENAMEQCVAQLACFEQKLALLDDRTQANKGDLRDIGWRIKTLERNTEDVRKTWAKMKKDFFDVLDLSEAQRKSLRTEESTKISRTTCQSHTDPAGMRQDERIPQIACFGRTPSRPATRDSDICDVQTTAESLVTGTAVAAALRSLREALGRKYAVKGSDAAKPGQTK